MISISFIVYSVLRHCTQIACSLSFPKLTWDNILAWTWHKICINHLDVFLFLWIRNCTLILTHYPNTTLLTLLQLLIRVDVWRIRYKSKFNELTYLVSERFYKTSHVVIIFHYSLIIHPQPVPWFNRVLIFLMIWQLSLLKHILMLLIEFLEVLFRFVYVFRWKFCNLLSVLKYAPHLVIHLLFPFRV